MTQTVILRGEAQRQLAKRLIAAAPVDAVVTIKAPTRSLDQNAKMWAMISDVSRAKPEGRTLTPELWKSLFMQACGHEVQFLNGLDGMPFPVGFRTSRLNKAQFGDLLEFIAAYGAQHGVVWSDETYGGRG